jgi:hypothetical protein
MVWFGRAEKIEDWGKVGRVGKAILGPAMKLYGDRIIFING